MKKLTLSINAIELNKHGKTLLDINGSISDENSVSHIIDIRKPVESVDEFVKELESFLV